MENETITPSEQYVTDFNNGYALAKEMPEVASILSKAIGQSERSGFQDGRKQFMLETVKEKTPDFLRSGRIEKVVEKGNKEKDRNLNKNSPDKD